MNEKEEMKMTLTDFRRAIDDRDFAKMTELYSVLQQLREYKINQRVFFTELGSDGCITLPKEIQNMMGEAYISKKYRALYIFSEKYQLEPWQEQEVYKYYGMKHIEHKDFMGNKVFLNDKERHILRFFLNDILQITLSSEIEIRHFDFEDLLLS